MNSLSTLLQSARHGDQDAMNELLERVYPRVSEDVHRRLRGNSQLMRRWKTAFSTGDMVQDIFIKIVLTIDRFATDDEAALVRFLGVLVRNTLVDRLRFFTAERRDPTRAVECTLPLASGEASPSAQVSAQEEIGLYREQLRAFSDREQRLLRMRIEGSVPFPVLAQELGYPSEDAARKAYNSARARLLVRLQRRGVRS